MFSHESAGLRPGSYLIPGEAITPKIAVSIVYQGHRHRSVSLKKRVLIAFQSACHVQSVLSTCQCMGIITDELLIVIHECGDVFNWGRHKRELRRNEHNASSKLKKVPFVHWDIVRALCILIEPLQHSPS